MCLPPLQLVCHAAARLRAGSANRHAFLHLPEALAVLCALRADFRALGAGMLVVRGAKQHEVGRCPANLGARHHQREMLLFNVLAHLQAVIHRRREAY